MEIFSALQTLRAGNSPVTGEFPSQRPVIRSFDVFFDLSLNKRLSKPSRRRWFETPARSIWRHCNGWPSMCPFWLYDRHWRAGKSTNGHTSRFRWPTVSIFQLLCIQKCTIVTVYPNTRAIFRAIFSEHTCGVNIVVRWCNCTIEWQRSNSIALIQ